MLESRGKTEVDFGLSRREKLEGRIAIAFMCIMLLPADVLQIVLSPEWDARLSALALVGIAVALPRNMAIKSANRKLREVLLASGLGEEPNHE